MSNSGVQVQAGPFSVLLKSDIRSFSEILLWFYQHFPLSLDPVGISDFHIFIKSGGWLDRLISSKAYFHIDNRPVFDPYPLKAALPLYEWGLNWCIAMRAHRYLLLHSAVIEKDNKAIILPAFPGSGKSTLCAALIHRGWRLFSDEFGIVRPENGMMIPMPRPIPLKNRSINVLKEFAPEADFGPVFEKTRKGTVSHVRAPRQSVDQIHVESSPSWIIFPRFVSGSKVILAQLPKSYALLKLATNSFNYPILGTEGFIAVRNIVRKCDCFNLVYGDLDEVVERMNALVEGS